MARAGERLRDGLAAQAADHGLAIRQSGPPQMPLLLFADDPKLVRGKRFAAEATRRGVYLHPWHNWFLSTAHTDDDIDWALERTNDAFAVVADEFGRS
jgi:glutamate-1-semialdehyde 2,1-aminomutase